MAVHRKRKTRYVGEAGGTKYKRAMSGQASITSRVTSAAVVSGASGDLGAAAAIIADAARALAAPWSSQIPGAISVAVKGNMAEISCQVGPAYPNEIDGVRHPTFGHDPWKTNQYRPFLAPAADAKADAAMARYADKIDTMARKAGFR